VLSFFVTTECLIFAPLILNSAARAAVELQVPHESRVIRRCTTAITTYLIGKTNCYCLFSFSSQFQSFACCDLKMSKLKMETH